MTRRIVRGIRVDESDYVFQASLKASLMASLMTSLIR
jgi:hypothetical protein